MAFRTGPAVKRTQNTGKRFQVLWVDRSGRERIYAQATSVTQARAHLLRGQEEHEEFPQVAGSFRLLDTRPDR